MERVGPGVYAGMPADWYHADPCLTPSLSSGVLRRLINGTPAHAYVAHPRLGGGNDDRSTPRTDFGSAAHRYVLGRGADVEVLTYADYRTNAAKAARDAAEAAGKIPLLMEKYAAVQRLVQPAREVLDGIASGAAEAEVVIVWEERLYVSTSPGHQAEPFAFLCRAMLDSLWRIGPLVIDYKTCNDCSPETFGRHLFQQDYDLQRAFYLRGVRKLFGDEARFAFLAQEMDTGICCLHEPDEHATDLADAMVTNGMQKWAESLKANRWPGYGTSAHPAMMPLWKAQRIESTRI